VGEGLLPIGAILGPQGLKGYVKIKPFTQTPESLSAYGPVTLGDGRTLQLQVKSVSAKGVVIVAAAGITNRDAAEALRGQTVAIARSSLPEPAEDELYHADLLGMRVVAGDGQLVGKIVALHNFGAGDVVEVAPAQGASVMLPFGGQRVISLDLAAGEVVLDVPDGLLAFDDTPPDEDTNDS
jgi:16S rRNA processing protein RimM